MTMLEILPNAMLVELGLQRPKCIFVILTSAIVHLYSYYLASLTPLMG